MLQYDELDILLTSHNKNTCHYVIFGSLIVTLNCMTQPLSGIISCVTAYTSLPSALPHTITPSGELQKRCTEQSSENNQWSLTENKEREVKKNHLYLALKHHETTVYWLIKAVIQKYLWVFPPARSAALSSLRSRQQELSHGWEVPPLQMCQISALVGPSLRWGHYPEPNHCGLLPHVVAATSAHALLPDGQQGAAAHSQTWTQTNTWRKSQISCFTPHIHVLLLIKLTQAWCTDRRRSLSAGASWFLRSNCTPEAHPGYGCLEGSCSRTWSRTGWTQRWSGSGPLSPADGCNSVHRNIEKCGLSQSEAQPV